MEALIDAIMATMAVTSVVLFGVSLTIPDYKMSDRGIDPQILSLVGIALTVFYFLFKYGVF